MATSPTITVRPLSGAIGAEIDGVNAADDLDQPSVDSIREALLKFNVVFLRDQGTGAKGREKNRTQARRD